MLPTQKARTDISGRAFALVGRVGLKGITYVTRKRYCTGRASKRYRAGKPIISEIKKPMNSTHEIVGVEIIKVIKLDGVKVCDAWQG